MVGKGGRGQGGRVGVVGSRVVGSKSWGEGCGGVNRWWGSRGSRGWWGQGVGVVR